MKLLVVDSCIVQTITQLLYKNSLIHLSMSSEKIYKLFTETNPELKSQRPWKIFHFERYDHRLMTASKNQWSTFEMINYAVGTVLEIPSSTYGSKAQEVTNNLLITIDEMVDTNEMQFGKYVDNNVWCPRLTSTQLMNVCKLIDSEWEKIGRKKYKELYK